MNQIQNIDLSPLSSCSSLQELDLGGNQLPSIKLGPLKKCVKLQFLDLRDTQLRIVNVTPLFECSSLDSLFFDSHVILTTDPKLRYQSPDNSPKALRLLVRNGQINYTALQDDEALLQRTFLGKILLIGKSRTGKSCLIWRFLHPDVVWSKEVEYPVAFTHGVETHELRLGDTIAFVWDFGGQVNYAYAHDLFFSERGIYLYVMKPEENPEHDMDRFDRWYKLFSTHGGRTSILVGVITHLDDNELSPYIDRTGKWFESLQNDPDYPNIHPQIFIVDSLEPREIAKLKDALPELMKSVGAVQASAIPGWSDVTQAVLALRPADHSDVGIRGLTELEGMIDIEQMGEAELGSVLSEMHFRGQVVFLPALIRHMRSIQPDVEPRVLLNADLASKCLEEIHSVAEKTLGKIDDAVLQTIKNEGLTFTRDDSYGNERTYEVTSSNVQGLLEFIEAAGISVRVKEYLLFPYSCTIELGESRTKWDELDCRPPTRVRWTDDATQSQIISQLAGLRDLDVFAVWKGGILFRRKAVNDLPEIFLKLKLEGEYKGFRATLSCRAMGGDSSLGDVRAFLLEVGEILREYEESGDAEIHNVSTTHVERPIVQQDTSRNLVRFIAIFVLAEIVGGVALNMFSTLLEHLLSPIHFSFITGFLLITAIVLIIYAARIHFQT
jgi:hypothetical protein